MITYNDNADLKAKILSAVERHQDDKDFLLTLFIRAIALENVLARERGADSDG